MEGSKEQEKKEKKVTEVKTFTVPFSLGEIKKNITITTNNTTKPSKEQIIKQAFKFHSQGNTQEATRLYQYFLNQDYKDHRVFSNYGVILRDLGKFKEAGLLYRKAIEIKPDDAMAHYNLGIILRDLGKLQDAELSTRKAIEMNPNLAEAHLNLGIILKDLGKLQEAELSTHKAIKIKPDLTEAHSSLGKILLRKGNHIEGIKRIKEATGFISFDLLNGLSIN